MSANCEQDAIERLREYLMIPSVHPDIDYSECAKFLEKQAQCIGLPVAVHEFVPKKHVIVITWTGSQPELPTVLLNSHMDVVPASEEYWTHPPFAAVVTKDGWLYARGSQDMKSVGMMHLEAIRRLKNAGVVLKRTVHVSFVPEIKITCPGTPGHGSLMTSNTAGEKLHYVIDKLMTLRATEKKKLESGSPIGDVITVNLTQLEGGVQVNVLPEKLSASFDMRIPPDVDHQDLENTILNWCKEAGPDVRLEYFVKNPEVKSTKIDNTVPFWGAMKTALNEMNIKIHCVTCPGATDARFLRRLGIPAINLTPLLNTPLLLHAHDERIHEDEYERGIDIMEKVVFAVANV